MCFQIKTLIFAIYSTEILLSEFHNKQNKKNLLIGLAVS